jgi:outer membrane cobalamin receptor
MSDQSAQGGSRITLLTLRRTALPLIILLLVSAGSARAFQMNARPADSTKTDTSSAHADSLRPPIPAIPLVGSIDRTLRQQDVVNDTSIDWLDYSYFGNLLEPRAGVFPHDLGSPGQFSTLSMNGANPNSIAYLSDGAPEHDPMTGLTDLNFIPTENFERTEIIPDTRAFLYSLNSTGGAINTVSQSLRAIKPYSRIHYDEYSYGNTYFDGLVSQDVLRGLNVTLGAEHATTGGRYLNSDYSQWNGRLKIRYNINSNVDVYVSDSYNTSILGLYGGIEDTVNPAYAFNNLQTSVRDTFPYEKQTRNVIQAGVAMRLLSDSTLVSSLTIWHSTNFREYRDEREVATGLPTDTNERDDNRSQWYGARLQHTLELFNHQQFELGAEVERLGVIASPITGEHLDTRTAFYGKSETTIFDNLGFAGYARIDNYLGFSKLGYGGDISLPATSLLTFTGGASLSYRFPTIQERFWNDSIIVGSSSLVPEQHALGEVGVRVQFDSSKTLNVKYFHRNISDAIEVVSTTATQAPSVFEFADVGKIYIEGVSGDGSIRIGKFVADGMFQVLNHGQDGYEPNVYGFGGIYYWTDHFSGHLNLKIGFRGRFFSSFQPPQYESKTQLLIPGNATPNAIGPQDAFFGESQTAPVGVGDFILIAKLGDAYIHFDWENLGARQYIVTRFYPMPDGGLRLGVSWDFLN